MSWRHGRSRSRSYDSRSRSRSRTISRKRSRSPRQRSRTRSRSRDRHASSRNGSGSSGHHKSSDRTSRRSRGGSHSSHTRGSHSSHTTRHNSSSTRTSHDLSSGGVPPPYETRPKRRPHCGLFVGRLPMNYREDQLKRLFRRFGEVLHCVKIPTKRFGFIELSTDEATQQAIREMHQSVLPGTDVPIVVSLSTGQSHQRAPEQSVQVVEPRDELYVTFADGQPPSDQDLVEKFQQCGELIGISVEPGRASVSKERIWHAFVKMGSESEAANAIRTLGKCTVQGIETRTQFNRRSRSNRRFVLPDMDAERTTAAERDQDARILRFDSDTAKEMDRLKTELIQILEELLNSSPGPMAKASLKKTCDELKKQIASIEHDGKVQVKEKTPDQDQDVDY